MQSTEREYLLLALRNAKSQLSVPRSSDPQNEEQWRESAGEIPGPRKLRDRVARRKTERDGGTCDSAAMVRGKSKRGVVAMRGEEVEDP